MQWIVAISQMRSVGIVQLTWMEAGSDPIMLHIIDSSYDTYPIFICTADLEKRKKKIQNQGEDYDWERFTELSCSFGNSFFWFPIRCSWPVSNTELLCSERGKLHTPLWQALLSILTYWLHRSISQQLIQSTQQGLITSWSLLIQSSSGEFLFAHQQTIPFCMSLK